MWSFGAFRHSREMSRGNSPVTRSNDIVLLVNVPFLPTWGELGQNFAHSIEGLSIDAKDLSGLRDVSFGENKNARHVSLLQFVEARQIGRHLLARGNRGVFRQEKVAGIDHRIGCQCQRTFDEILELARIARKRVAHQVLQRVLGDPDVVKAFALTVLVEEEADEFGDVFLPLPQRGERDLDHLESIVEILAELAAFDHPLQALMRRGEDPHIDGDSAPAAELLDLPFLQYTQQLRLQGERNVTHFVEEDRATACQLEFSRPGLDAGGHAALDAEEL